MRSLLASLVCLSLLLPGAASAGIDKAGTTGASFLSVGAGADVLGMGGTTLGFGSGLGAAAWNIAALGNLNYSEYVFSHAALTGESPQDWIAAGGRFGASHTHWGLTGLYQGDGSFEGRDASNNPTASFNASSMALGVQLAQGFGSGSSIGVGMKYATEKLGDVTGGGVTFDAGVRLQAGPLGFGAAAQNAFGKMNYSGLHYDFPTNYGAGVAFTIPSSGVTLAVDANFPNAYYTDVRTGVEWRYRDRLALRTGYRKELDATDGEPLGGPTFGMGAGANGFWLDYGYLTGGASGSGQHRVALTYRPGFLNGGAQALTQPEPRVTHVSEPKAARIVEPKPEKTPKANAPVATPKAAIVEAPKVEGPKAESAAPKVEASKVSAPAIVETPKAAAPAPVAPKAIDAPKVSAPAAVAPKTIDAAKAAAPAAVAPKAIDAPKAAAPAAPKAIDAPKAAAPATPAKVEPAPTKGEAPKGDAVKAAPAKVMETPKPVVPAPKAEAPKQEAAKPVPPVEVKPVEKPAVEAPKEAPAPAPAPVVEAPKPAPAPVKAKEEPRPETIKVKGNETLADIAKRWGNSVPAIMMENNMVRDTVKPGQTLKLPPKGR